MKADDDLFASIDAQQERMLKILHEWAAINSYSDHAEGLSLMLKTLSDAFEPLNGSITDIPVSPRTTILPTGIKKNLPSGKALSVIKRPNAPFRILLGGHMDTVYPPQTASAIQQSGHRLLGPGVADMKGGLVILLIALEAFENHPSAKNIGWEVLITPDEEIGSIGSKDLWKAAATRNHCALLFEPAFPDGALVSERRGSANWTLTVKGVAAHAGRDFQQGRNAIVAISQYIQQAHHLNSSTDATINIGSISGGGPVNIVPDTAMCRINARVKTQSTFEYINKVLEDFAQAGSGNGIHMQLHLENYRPPKKLTQSTQVLIDTLETCAQQDGYGLIFRATGGVCDGNILAEAGLPVVDTLGVIGGELHTPQEYMEIPSLCVRTKLVLRFLLHIANNPTAFLKQLNRT